LANSTIIKNLIYTGTHSRAIAKALLPYILQAGQHWSNGTIHKLMDPVLEDNHLEEIAKCVNVALL
jgi:hypothetical protein